jgi:DNA-binding GntR family transcriptional regulator
MNGSAMGLPRSATDSDSTSPNGDITSTKSAAQRVVEHVQQRIIAGAFPPGELITEGQVAAELSVSRTPVREAFKGLEGEGWLRVYPKRGALVVPVSWDDVQDVYEARRVVDRWVTETLVKNGIPDQTLREVEASIRASRDDYSPDDLRRYRESMRDFHRILVRGTGNRVMAQIVDRLLATSLRMGLSAVHPKRVELLKDCHIGEHEEILAAILAGDGERAIELTESHLQSNPIVQGDGRTAQPPLE